MGGVYMPVTDPVRACSVAKRDDHNTAGRIMAEIPWRPEHGHVAQIGEDLPRLPDEVAEPRVARTDEAPDDAQRNQPGDGVAGGDVHLPGVIAGHVAARNSVASDR
jgi:hypothetical protein